MIQDLDNNDDDDILVQLIHSLKQGTSSSKHQLNHMKIMNHYHCHWELVPVTSRHLLSPEDNRNKLIIQIPLSFISVNFKTYFGFSNQPRNMCRYFLMLIKSLPGTSSHVSCILVSCRVTQIVHDRYIGGTLYQLSSYTAPELLD